MILNKKKTKNMIFNFSKKQRCTTRLIVDDENIEVIKEIKLSGTIITDYLIWDANTQYIVKKSWKRMQLLHTAAKFTKERNDLKSI